MIENENLQYDATTNQIFCNGKWDIHNFNKLKKYIDRFNLKLINKKKYSINGEHISKLDSAGSWLLINLKNKIEKHSPSAEFIHFNDNQKTLLAMVSKHADEIIRPTIQKKSSWLTQIGEKAVQQFLHSINFLSFVGHLSIETSRIFFRPRNIRWNALAGTIFQTGYQALPIIALLSFMIGVVLTYQMGLQLKNYGANIYIVDLLGLSILREFAPLLTAIIIAGRTGSSFTAQLGMMKINQEIDALNTMGITPAELLLLPRIVGLVIALPLLTMWSDIFGVLGGMVMSNSMLNITWYDFLQRFSNVIPLKTLIIGLGKTPVFALLIGSIGCFQGMTVAGTADSVGRNTTRSVVLGIFFIIIADAFFSIVFSKLKL